VADIETYRQELRKRGLSITRARLAVLKALHEMGRTASPVDLLAWLRQEHAIHKTTVYRNLEVLEEAGLVVKVPSGGRSFIYELACGHVPQVHPHFSCRRCDRIFCLAPVDLSSVWGLLTRASGLKAERAEVTLVGLCEGCAAAQGSSEAP
jgi:Fe2+ or Zn2+ uptake regulation protein